jgi:hypothetical protein
MNRIPFILSTIAVAFLAGCATEQRITPAPAPAVVTPVVVAPQQPAYVLTPSGPVMVLPPPQTTTGTVSVTPAAVALRSGFGRIESMQAVPSAASGGSVSNPTRRIAMRMEDGTLQYFDTQAPGMAVGERIEITGNGTLRQ